MKKLLLLAASASFLFTLGACASSSKTVKLNLNDPTIYDTYFTKAFNQHPDVCYDVVMRVSGRVNLDDVMHENQNERKIVTERFNPLMQVLGVESMLGRKTELQYAYSIYGDEQSCVLRMTEIHVWLNDVEQSTYDYVVGENNNWATSYVREMDNYNQEKGRTAPKAAEIPLSSITYSYK